MKDALKYNLLLDNDKVRPRGFLKENIIDTYFPDNDPVWFIDKAEI